MYNDRDKSYFHYEKKSYILYLKSYILIVNIKDGRSIM